ncbi:MAG: hypothetical protein NTW87_13815 [Planctomycetota bacterium]|nr:hypothetical protein [Planctomycetota bacterium]
MRNGQGDSWVRRAERFCHELRECKGGPCRSRQAAAKQFRIQNGSLNREAGRRAGYLSLCIQAVQKPLPEPVKPAEAKQ